MKEVVTMVHIEAFYDDLFDPILSIPSIILVSFATYVNPSWRKETMKEEATMVQAKTPPSGFSPLIVRSCKKHTSYLSRLPRTMSLEQKFSCGDIFAPREKHYVEQNCCVE